MTKGTSRVHGIVRGKVQGVFFRASMRAEAKRLGLRGWVRNGADGAVELLAEGEREALDALLAWARRGPPAAEVQGVEVKWSDAEGDLSAFDVVD